LLQPKPSTTASTNKFIADKQQDQAFDNTPAEIDNQGFLSMFFKKAVRE
jgi:hypothetical protein